MEIGWKAFPTVPSNLLLLWLIKKDSFMLIIFYIICRMNTKITFSKVFSEMYRSRHAQKKKKIKLSSGFCLLLCLTSPKISVSQFCDIYCLNGCSAQCFLFTNLFNCWKDCKPRLRHFKILVNAALVFLWGALPGHSDFLFPVVTLLVII